MITFGPVPSRRLGRSLGINNIPPKICTYSCVYCQLGRTYNMEIKPSTFYDPGEIINSIEEKLDIIRNAGESVDYITFVPDGETSLDIRLGETIERLKSFKIKIAVITNSSMIWRDNVRNDLAKADWISLKFDSVQEKIWRKINRPHGSLDFEMILEGIIEFAKMYRGKLNTETMLVGELNDQQDQLDQLAEFICQIPQVTAYVSIPIRPPAEKWIHPPTEETLIRTYQTLHSKMINVELLIGYEGNAFSVTGNAAKDIMSITAVHPMREEAVIELLDKDKADWSAIERLLDAGILVRREFQGKNFFARKLFNSRTRGILDPRLE